MIILDTNVVSELMRTAPAPQVIRWVDGQPPLMLYITTLTQAEILHGILLLPKGKRRDALAVAAERMFDDDFGGRVLVFGSDAARAYAEIAAERRRAGLPISSFDAQIAAVARSLGAGLATRNVDDFAGCEIVVHDPWKG